MSKPCEPDAGSGVCDRKVTFPGEVVCGQIQLNPPLALENRENGCFLVMRPRVGTVGLPARRSFFLLAGIPTGSAAPDPPAARVDPPADDPLLMASNQVPDRDLRSGGHISRLTAVSGARRRGTGILPVDARQTTWAGCPCHSRHRQSADAPRSGLNGFDWRICGDNVQPLCNAGA